MISTSSIRSGGDQSQFLLFGQVMGNMVAIVFALTALGCVIANITRRYRDEALHDPLSGLPNRRQFDTFHRIEWNRAAHIHQPLSLLMIDIDMFKAFNDTYGHPAGDRCLIRVADAIRSSVHPQSYLCARLGGEEFVVLLPGMGTEDAEAVAETICHAVHRAAIPHENSPLGVVTVSIGVATVIPAGKYSGRLLEAADTGLYRAKHNGRNRVEVFG